MALTITETRITSGLTGASAEFRPHASADGQGAWVTSLRPGRLLTRSEAIAAVASTEKQAESGLGKP